MEKDNLDRIEKSAVLRETILDRLMPISAITTAEEFSEAVGLVPPQSEIEQARRDRMLREPGISQMVDAAVARQTGSDGRRSPMDRLMDEYMEHLQGRRDRTEQQGDAMNKAERLGPSAYRNLQNSVKVMRAHFQTIQLTSLDDMQLVEQGLLSFKRSLDDDVRAGRKSPSYAQCLTRAVRPMFERAWKSREIDEIPRVIDEVTRAPQSKPAAKPLPVKTIRKLWKHADPSMRCYIALGLNAGLYAVDISKMTDEHLIERDGATYLALRRSKTNAPGRWKLWPLTLGLIEQTRQDYPDGRLFGNKRGKELVRAPVCPWTSCVVRRTSCVTCSPRRACWRA